MPVAAFDAPTGSSVKEYQSHISQSRKDAAKQFRRWVNHDLLPTLRKTGTYSLQKQSDSFTSSAIETMKAIQQSLLNMHSEHKSLEKRVEKLEKEPKQPKALKSPYGSPKGTKMTIRVYARTHRISVEFSDLSILGKMAVKESDKRGWPIGQSKEMFSDGAMHPVNTYYQDVLKTVFEEWQRGKGNNG